MFLDMAHYKDHVLNEIRGLPFTVGWYVDWEFKKSEILILSGDDAIFEP